MRYKPEVLIIAVLLNCPTRYIKPIPEVPLSLKVTQRNTPTFFNFKSGFPKVVFLAKLLTALSALMSSRNKHESGHLPRKHSGPVLYEKPCTTFCSF